MFLPVSFNSVPIFSMIPLADSSSRGSKSSSSIESMRSDISSDAISNSRASIASINSIGSIEPSSSESKTPRTSKTVDGSKLSPKISEIPFCNSGPFILPSKSASMDSKT